MRIAGRVREGKRETRQQFNEGMMQEVTQITGWWPYAGTLNVQPDDSAPVNVALLTSGPPLAECLERKWWSGSLELPDNTKMAVLGGCSENGQDLEIIAPLSLRTAVGIRDGDPVSFIPNEHL